MLIKPAMYQTTALGDKVSERDATVYKERVQKRRIRQGPGHSIYGEQSVFFCTWVMAVKPRECKDSG